MKRYIPFIVIFIFIMGCAASFKERREVSRPLVDLAMESLTKDDVQGTLVNLKKAEKANPEDPEVYYGFALAYWRSGKPAKAILYCNRAITYSDKLKLERPGMASKAYNLKGVILFKQGKTKKATEAFQKALNDELYTTPEYPLYNLGEIYISKDEFDQAKQSLKKALDHNYHYAPAWEALARVSIAKKNIPAAINALKHAIMEFPGFAEAHLELADLYLKTGDTPKAINHLNRVVRLDRDGPLGRMASKRLKELGITEQK